MTIELATKQDHLEGANFVVTINSRRSYAANTVEEAWEIIDRQPMGACYEVRSPAGLDVEDFVPY